MGAAARYVLDAPGDGTVQHSALLEIIDATFEAQIGTLQKATREHSENVASTDRAVQDAQTECDRLKEELDADAQRTKSLKEALCVAAAEFQAAKLALKQTLDDSTEFEAAVRTAEHDNSLVASLQTRAAALHENSKNMDAFIADLQSLGIDGSMVVAIQSTYSKEPASHGAFDMKVIEFFETWITSRIESASETHKAAVASLDQRSPVMEAARQRLDAAKQSQLTAVDNYKEADACHVAKGAALKVATHSKAAAKKALTAATFQLDSAKFDAERATADKADFLSKVTPMAA